MDEDVMKALEGKKIGQEALLNAVKARLDKDKKEHINETYYDGKLGV